MSEKRKKGNVKTIVLAVIAVIVILVAAALAAGYMVLRYYISASNFVSDDQVTIDADYLQHAANEGVLEEGDLATLSDDEASKIEEEIQAVKAKRESLGADQQSAMEQCYSILLIGSDRRTNNWYGNSDAMILLTINSSTKKIYMTSFMRDLYANIPNIGVRKLNAAHANGGGPLLVSTLESNYGVSIDNYASVDFNSMSTIIDMVNGVDLDVSTEEARVANGYIDEICALQGKDANAYHIQGGGVIHLNGIQAVSFARIRYVGNADYERTARQREVMVAILNKAKSMGVGELTQLANSMVPLITHNLDEGTILTLITRIPELLSYEVVTDRIPYDGLYYSSNEMLIPDFEQTIERLHSTIYATE